jgi:hypothetical protein
VFDVNFLAIAVAAATFLVGGLWYAKPVLGAAWNREAGVLAPGEPPTPGKRPGKHPGQVFGMAYVFSFLGAWALAAILGPHPTVAQGVKFGALVGFGVAATSFGVNYQFAARSVRMWAIDGGYHTLHVTLMGLVLGLFG